MNSSPRFVVRSVAWIGVAMLIIVLFHIGGSTIALRVGQFSPLTGAFIGGFLTLTCVILPIGRREATEPWLRNEQLGWILIGCGVIMWGLGESFWRYYVSIGESPFPSLADIGYFSFPLLVSLVFYYSHPPVMGANVFYYCWIALSAWGPYLQ